MLKEHKKSRISQLLDLWGMDSTHPNTDLYGVGKEYDGAKMLLNFSMKKKNENFFWLSGAHKNGDRTMFNTQSGLIFV